MRWQLLTELARSDLRVRELVTLVGQPQNLVSYHLRLLREGGLVTSARSSFDGRDSYYHLDLDRCASGLAGTGAALRRDGTTPAMPRLPSRAVLVVCTGNSARSPIAEALLRRYTAGRVRVSSAGSRPQPRLHPYAVRVMRDNFGIDVANQRPRHWDTLSGHRFDYVITLCDRAREGCPEFDGRPRRLHWSVPDPAADSGYPAYIRAAADIDTRVRHFLPVLADTDPAPAGTDPAPTGTDPAPTGTDLEEVSS